MYSYAAGILTLLIMGAQPVIADLDVHNAAGTGPDQHCIRTKHPFKFSRGCCTLLTLCICVPTQTALESESVTCRFTGITPVLFMKARSEYSDLGSLPMSGQSCISKFQLGLCRRISCMKSWACCCLVSVATRGDTSWISG